MLLETPKAKKQLISLTPLIDVVFILLLFFMLSSTFNRTKQLEIKASTTHKAYTVQDNTSVKILVKQDGLISIDGRIYQGGSPELTAELENVATDGSKVMLAAQAQVSVQRVIQMIDQTKQAGIVNLSLSESVAP